MTQSDCSQAIADLGGYHVYIMDCRSVTLVGTVPHSRVTATLSVDSIDRRSDVLDLVLYWCVAPAWHSSLLAPAA